MKNKILITTSLITLAILFRLFFGIYVDDEFGEKSLFIKHRPTWKWKFYSPLGMSDMNINDLTKVSQDEEKYYDEFIRQNLLN